MSAMAVTNYQRRKPGYQDEAAKAQSAEKLEKFCDLILEVRSTLGFAATARGHCYYLEGPGRDYQRRVQQGGVRAVLILHPRLGLLLTT
jgi:hypothetical protein